MRGSRIRSEPLISLVSQERPLTRGGGLCFLGEIFPNRRGLRVDTHLLEQCERTMERRVALNGVSSRPEE